MVNIEYILDTDHVIWMVNNDKDIQAKIETIGPEKIAISAITLAEMEVPLAKKGTEKYRRQIAFLEKNFRILPFTAYREYGILRASLEEKGKRLDDMDMLIAATALQQGATLVTNNEKHFGRIKELKSVNLKKEPIWQ